MVLGYKPFLVTFVFLLLLSCTKKTSYQKPEDLAVAFWNMLFFQPSNCFKFMKDHMALESNREFHPASEEQARHFCERREDYIRLYTKPINITARVDTEYQKGKIYLIGVELHTPRGEPTVVKTSVVKIKDRWYVVP